MLEPENKRAIAFIDGSNVRYAAKEAFGDEIGNHNPLALAKLVCEENGWQLSGVHYYIGVPDINVTEDGHYAWMKRCSRWRRQGVNVFTRALQHDDAGTPREKGIDVRLALDVMAHHTRGDFDVAIIFSQDQDFSEVVDEVKSAARLRDQWIQVVSAFPHSDQSKNGKGISGTLPVQISGSLFEQALDTSANRKLRFSPHDEDRTDEITPLDTIEESANGADIEPHSVGTKKSYSFVLSTLAALYLAGTLITFGHMAWETLDLQADFADLSAQLESFASALTWPQYWLTKFL